MGSEEDRQKTKRQAAEAYDYETDSRWADYWSNIPIHPHVASRPGVIRHFRLKFYQRYIDPDLVVEAMPSGNSSQSSRRSQSASSTTNEQTRPRTSGSTARTTGPSSTGAAAANQFSLLIWPTIQFFINAWVFVVAVLAIIPIVPRKLSNRAYRLAFLGTGCSSLYSLYTLHGQPRAWNMQAVQVWFQSVIVTRDFISFFYSLSITPHLYLRFSLLPILCRSVEHAAKFLRLNFSTSSLYRKYLEDPCLWVESNTTTLNILSSHAEIGLGFLLVISLFSWQRNIIQTFIYWQLLKLMYHAPVTAGYHQSVWTKIGRTVNPLIHRHAPFLNTPLSVAQRWWLA